MTTRTAVLEKARADYDAGFSSAYHDGLEEGAHKNAIEIAKNMLIKGYDFESVAECTGLSLEFIQALQIELKGTASSF